MIDTKLLGDKVNNASLLRSESARERKLVAHSILFEDKDTGVDLQGGWIIEIELVLRRFGRWRRGNMGGDGRLVLDI